MPSWVVPTLHVFGNINLKLVCLMSVRGGMAVDLERCLNNMSSIVVAKWVTLA